MYKRYIKKEPEVLVEQWDGYEITLLSINTHLCSQHPGSSAVRSQENPNVLTLVFKSNIGEYRTFHDIGDVVVLNLADEMPYRRLFGCTKEKLHEDYVLSPASSSREIKQEVSYGTKQEHGA